MRWRDITHKPTCRDASRYEFLLPTDPQNREQATESSKPSLSPEMAALVAGLREEAEYSEHYGGLVYVNNNNLILLLDALEGKSHE